MRFLITGATGQLGLEIIDRLKEIGVNDDSILGTCFDIEKALKDGKIKNVVKMDITNPYETEKVIEEFNPDIIFHCAAWTAVDKAESEEFKEKCFEVNNYGTKNVAINATKVGAKMVSFSTDYVFDGYSKYYKSYHTPNPINNYGRSKFGSEKMTRNYCPKSFVIRTSWLFGLNGNNFAKNRIHSNKKHKLIFKKDNSIDKEFKELINKIKKDEDSPVLESNSKKVNIINNNKYKEKIRKYMNIKIC